ncbi:MAG: hypothetical protein PHW79_03950 [Candidatus Marinimicrobia bacterium]|nr:hypothetical protein [Candidatus Neomarinimicrobiota bacterium]
MSEPIKKKLLEKILSSSEFSGSKNYASYLLYLVEASDNGKNLKETSIAIEFFGKDASFNPAEDTLVRTHTYTLRKKLQNYYYNEGKDDKYHLNIPKGHYDATFVPVSENLYRTKRLIVWLAKKYYIPILGVLCIILTILWIHDRSLSKKLQSYQFIEKSDPIWKEYLQSNLPVLVVAGDHFFFDMYSEKFQSVVCVRHGKVNSLEEFEAIKRQYSDASAKPTDEPYFPYHSVWSLPPIFSILFAADQKPLLRKSSSITPQTLSEYNIIYVGSIKTLYTLKHTLSKSHFRYEILPHKITYSPSDTSRVQTFTTSLHSSGPNEDLILAVKLPGPAKNSIFIIASYHSLGAPEVVSYLTQSSTREAVEQKFIEKYHKVPKYFEILFRVTGIDKTAYSTEMLIYNEIPAD